MWTWTRTVGVAGVLLLGIAIGQVGIGPPGLSPGASRAQAQTQTQTQAQVPAPVVLQAGASAMAAAGAGAAQAASGGAERTVWYFYTVAWGKQNEFLDLFQKNHYPILKAQLGTRLVGVKTYVPAYHGDGRADWTFAVQITFKDAAALTDPSQEEELAKKLFPDLTKFHAEEQERFTLLEAHWDVPLNEVNFETRRPVVRR